MSSKGVLQGSVLQECQVRVFYRSEVRVSYIGVCRDGVCVSDLCRRSYFGVCRGSVCVSDLFRRSFIGVCRGGVCVSDASLGLRCVSVRHALCLGGWDSLVGLFPASGNGSREKLCMEQMLGGGNFLVFAYLVQCAYRWLDTFVRGILGRGC